MGNHRLFSLCALVAVVILLLCLLEGTRALKCRTEDGPSSDEVRKVIRTCMRRISTETKNKSNEADDGEDDGYGNYDSSYSDSENDGNGKASTEENMKRQSGSGMDGGNGQMGNTRGRNGEDRNSGRDSGRNSDDRRGEGRNREDNNGGRRRDREWDYNIGTMERRSDARNPYGRYKRQYYNDGAQGGYGYQQNDRYNRDRNNFMSSSSGNNTSNGSNNVEHDRACLMQCFFQEMKMTNNDGLPDKHKVLHVVTKDLRDYELRDFYTDSIQECFHMISMDNRIRDKCDYSMRFVTCLADRGQANCNDWENETIIF